MDWTETYLYMQLVEMVCSRVGVKGVESIRDDGVITSLSGVPRPFEAFIMMMVRVLLTICEVSMQIVTLG